jgi:hypothetical protein
MAPAASAIDILVDDFNNPGTPAWTSITPAVGTLTAPGDMFESGSRGATISSGFGLPFAISDDSVAPAVGNTLFAIDSQGVVGMNKTDGFFGVVDLVNDQNLAGTGSVEWTVNITGLTNLSLSVDVGAMGDFEQTGANADVYSFSVSINGGGFVPVMIFAADDSASHTYRLLDSQGPAADFDLNGSVGPEDLQIWEDFYGLEGGATKADGNANGGGTVDGIDFLIWQRLFGQSGETPTTLNDPLKWLGPDGVLGGGDDVIVDKTDRATGALDTFNAAIIGTGTTMVIRFDAKSDGGAEAFAFDDLIVSGDAIVEIGAVPEPTTFVLCGLALGALALRRRRV